MQHTRARPLNCENFLIYEIELTQKVSRVHGLFVSLISIPPTAFNFDYIYSWISIQKGIPIEQNKLCHIHLLFPPTYQCNLHMTQWKCTRMFFSISLKIFAKTLEKKLFMVFLPLKAFSNVHRLKKAFYKLLNFTFKNFCENFTENSYNQKIN